MKDKYVSPEIEVIELDAWHDIVTSSVSVEEGDVDLTGTYGLRGFDDLYGF